MCIRDRHLNPRVGRRWNAAKTCCETLLRILRGAYRGGHGFRNARSVEAPSSSEVRLLCTGRFGCDLGVKRDVQTKCSQWALPSWGRSFIVHLTVATSLRGGGNASTNAGMGHTLPTATAFLSRESQADLSGTKVEGSLDVWAFRCVPSMRANASALADAFASGGGRGTEVVGVVVQTAHRDPQFCCNGLIG